MLKLRYLFVVLCIFLASVASGGQDPQNGDYGKELCLVNTLPEAFEYCGVNWLELDEKCESSNYHHYRISTKNCYIAMFKPQYEEDRYFFVGKEDNYWLVRRKLHEEDSVYSLPWAVYKVMVDAGDHLTTRLFREMLAEFIDEILGKHCPSFDRDGSQPSNAGKNPKVI